MKISYSSDDAIVFESALFRTTTTLVRGENYLLLVDPNWLPLELDFIADQVKQWLGDRQPYLLFTHSDYDHIIGYRRFPGFRTIASLNLVESKDSEKVLKQISDFDDENYIIRDYPIEYPRIDLVIRAAERWRIGEDEYQFFQARGHNPDGIISFNRTQGILIVGDYLSNIEFPYVYDSVQRYRHTLAGLEVLIQSGEVELLISGHGDPTSDQAEMLKRLSDSRKYLEDLEQSVKENGPFDFEQLMKQYAFPKIMRKFHDANLKLMRQELAKSIE